MTIVYTQTDTNDTAIRTISPFGTVQADVSKRMAEGATAGSVEGMVSVASSNFGQTGNADLNFRTADGDPATNVPAGNWTVRFNVTTANMNLSWEGVGISCVNAAESAATTVATDQNMAISCSTTGVKTDTFAGGAVSTNTDHIQVSIGFSNSAMSTQTLGITPSEDIDSPLSAAVAVLPPLPFNVDFAVTRAASY